MKARGSRNIIAGNLACLGAYLIFGFNLVCCKNISNFGGIGLSISLAGVSIVNFSKQKQKKTKDFLQPFIKNCFYFYGCK